MKEIIVSIFCFVLAFGFVSLTETQVITMERFVLVVIFLLTVTVLILFSFRKLLFGCFRNVDVVKSFLLVSVSLLFHLFVSYILVNYLPQPEWPFSSKDTSFLLMNDYYVWAKPFDVLVQQLLILVLVLKLSLLGVSVRKISILFVFGFGAIHIFQIFITDLIIGLLFTIGAVFSSLVYPYMIIKKKNGFIYNFMIHLAIYNIAAILAYTLY